MSSHQIPPQFHDISLAIFSDRAGPAPELLEQAMRTAGAEVRSIKGVSELRALEDQSFFAVQAIIIAPGYGGSSAGQISLLSELRGEPDLTDMPIIVLPASGHALNTSALYERGASLVLPEFTPATDVLLAVESLIRMRDKVRSLAEHAHGALLGEQLLFDALSLSPYPIIVWNEFGDLIWMNPHVEQSFRISHLPESLRHAYLVQLSATCAPLLTTAGQSARRGWTFTDEVSLPGGDGVISPWKFECVPVLDSSGRISRYVTQFQSGLLDLVFAERSSHLAQLESIALLTAAASHKLIQERPGQIVVAPYRQIEHTLQGDQGSTNLNAVITALLEYLDPIINPKVVIKVGIPVHAEIAMPWGDAFQLTGHLLLTAIDFAAGSGEIVVEATPHEPGKGTVITLVTNSSSRSLLMDVLDAVSQKRELFSHLPDPHAPEHEKQGHENSSTERRSPGLNGDKKAESSPFKSPTLSTRFDRLRELSARYRTEVQLQTKAKEILKLRIALPSRI